MASNHANRNPRAPLAGWRYHPKAARVLMVLLAVGVCASSWLPKDWPVIRSALQVVGSFAAGMLASKEAAIWQRTDDQSND